MPHERPRDVAVQRCKYALDGDGDVLIVPRFISHPGRDRGSPHPAVDDIDNGFWILVALVTRLSSFLRRESNEDHCAMIDVSSEQLSPGAWIFNDRHPRATTLVDLQ